MSAVTSTDHVPFARHVTTRGPFIWKPRLHRKPTSSPKWNVVSVVRTTPVVMLGKLGHWTAVKKYVT